MKNAYAPEDMWKNSTPSNVNSHVLSVNTKEITQPPCPADVGGWWILPPDRANDSR